MLIDKINEIIEECEEIQRNNNESDFNKDNAIIKAYNEIKYILGFTEGE